MSPFAISVLVICSCAAFFARKLLRFKRYREYINYGPLGKLRKYHPGCMGFEDVRYDPIYDPISEAQLIFVEQWLQDKEHYENLVKQPGLSVAERAGMELAYMELQSVRGLERIQREAPILAEQEARRAQQRQEWKAMKQIAATKSLWWQFWHCS